MPNFSIPISGLEANSAALATTANNLANLNTTGYKDQQIQFADLFYQNLGTDGAGDPIEQGFGVKVSSQNSDFSQGNDTSTGVDTDVAINGNGFFVVQQNGVQTYTRDGNFQIGTNNLLETANGQQVLGYQAVNGVIPPGQTLGSLSLGAGTSSPAVPTANISLTSNLNATGGVGSTYSTQATIYDSLGAPHQLTFTYTNTGPNTWNYSVSIPAADLTQVGGVPSPTLATGTLTFNGNGVLASDSTITPVVGTNTPPANITGIPITSLADGASNQTFNWNVLNGTTPLLTQLAAPNSTASIQQDGASSGTLQSFNIGADGTITGSFSNGTTATLGQLALATFADEQGLTRNGNNDYSPTIASGQPNVGTPESGSLGSVSGGALEGSNVDIATEFANLIVAQRSYEANARVVTTFDTIAQDTIALKQ